MLLVGVRGFEFVYSALPHEAREPGIWVGNRFTLGLFEFLKKAARDDLGHSKALVT